MTEQEAIDYFNNVTIDTSIGLDNITKASEIINISIKALEKQIPKEPIIVHPLQENDSGEFACPICKTGALVKKIDKFCWECGQAIKWE